MNLTVWQALGNGFLQPFTLSMSCILMIYILWITVLSLEEQESSSSFKKLLFANVTSRSLQLYPHRHIAKRAWIFVITFVFSFMLSLGNLQIIKGFLLVLGAVFIILLGLDTFGLLYLTPLFKESDTQNLRSSKRLTAIILGLTLGFAWKGPGIKTIQMLQASSISVVGGYLAGLALAFFILAILINILFNVVPRLRKLKKIFINTAGLLFITIGFMVLLGKCPFLG